MPAIEIEKWIDQDLSLAAREGRLPPAFETDVVVRQIEEVLRADPPRSPIVTGRSGIGKTAVIGELVRRAVAGEGSPLLKGHRVVQLSIANISAQFKDKEQAADFARQLFDALAAEEIIPFVRDFGLAYTLDWEPIIYRFLTQSGRPLLGEAPAQLVDQMIDWSSDLAAHLVPVPVEEPRGERLSRIVAQWAQMQEARTHRSLTPEAQSIAMELTGRFLGDRPFPRKVLDLLAQTRDLAQPDPYGVVVYVPGMS